MSEMRIGDDALNQGFARILPHLCDVSLRDGIQSWDGSRWTIAEILGPLKEFYKLHQMAPQYFGVSMGTPELAGGQQFGTPARVLGENPFDNLRLMTDAAPGMGKRMLCRGAQGVGFKPISPEIQALSIETFIENGVTIVKNFDMMKDPKNYQPGTQTFIRYQQNHPESDATIEIAIPYMNELLIAPDEPRAWEISDYGSHAVDLTHDCAAADARYAASIKDYIGYGDNEFPVLIPAVKASLEAAGRHISLNLHSHGEKPKVLLQAIQDGIDKVDVAIGELSGGPSHTNMRNLIYAALPDFSPEEIDAHPWMQQLAKVEDEISKVVHAPRKVMVNGEEVDGPSFYDTREILRRLDPERMKTYPVAAGALADLAHSLMHAHNNDIEKALHDFYAIMDETPALWKMAGHFDTVTPGSKIIVDQAKEFWKLKRSSKNKNGFIPQITDYTREYRDLVIGRYGRNQGMDKGIGDKGFRDAVLLHDALQIINQEPTSVIPFAKSYHDAASTFLPRKKGSILIDLVYPDINQMLKTANPEQVEQFKTIVTKSAIKSETKAQILAALTPGHAPPATDGLEVGKQIVAACLPKEEVLVPAEAKEFALLAMLLRDQRPDGSPDDKIFKNLFKALIGQREQKLAATPHAAIKENNP